MAILYDYKVKEEDGIFELDIRDETVQYIDILHYLLLQYNTIWFKGDIDVLQYIAMFVVLML